MEERLLSDWKCKNRTGANRGCQGDYGESVKNGRKVTIGLEIVAKE